MARQVRTLARADDPRDVIRPFALIGAVAFATGFWGYMALAPLFGGG